MVEPVGPRPSFPIQPKEIQLKQKANVISEQILEFHDLVGQLLADPSRVDQTESLYQIAECIQSLQKTSLEAKKL